MSVLITFDGPNGVGKTTLIDKLYKKLDSACTVYRTREPSNTAFGHYVKYNELAIRGLAYAYLICADRAYHYEVELKEALEIYDIVMCDRYVGSSMALQVFDGVSADKIWELNAGFHMPDLSIFLTADINEVEQRLSERIELSYFERKMTRAEEMNFYCSAYMYMKKKEIPTLLLDNSMSNYKHNLEKLYSIIDDMIGVEK